MTVKVDMLREMLDKETVLQCGHEERVGTLSMSWLDLSDEEILQRVKGDVQTDDRQKLKLYLGTLLKRGIRERLEKVCARGAVAWTPPRLITAFDGKLTGHIDGAIDKVVVKIKTVPNEKILSEIKCRGKIPSKIECEINAFMLWGTFERAIVIYEERESGTHWLTERFPNKHMQRDLHFKVKYLLNRLYGGEQSERSFGKMNKIFVKELRHVILKALKEKQLHGKAQLDFSDIWGRCSLAGPSLAQPVNSELQRENFARTFFENLDFLTTTDMIGVVTKEDDRKIDFIFLTPLGEQYVKTVEFVDLKKTVV